MGSITNSKRKMQTKKRPNTSQKLLEELEQQLPGSIIQLHANLTSEELNDILNGAENSEVYARLLSLWSFLYINKSKDDEFKMIIEGKKAQGWSIQNTQPDKGE